MRKNFIEKIIILLSIILLSPIIFFIILVYPIIKIKIFELETRAIGHFTKSIEVFLSEIRSNIHPTKKILYICFPNKFIANKFLFKKWKDHIIILPRIIIEPLFFFFRIFPFGRIFLAPYRHWTDNSYSWKKPSQLIDIYGTISITKPILKFSNLEISRGNSYLKKHGIDYLDNYICLSIRNPNYYFNRNLINKIKLNLRDSNVRYFFKAIKYLSTQYKIFNLGEKLNIDLNLSNLILYNNSTDKSDFLDIFLPFHCKYIISTGTGLDHVSVLNRKPRFILNSSEIYNLWAFDYEIDLFTPKKFKSLSTGKFIPYSDVLKLRLSEYQYLDDLNKDGYDCINNTEEEILDAVKEVEFFYKNKKYLNNDMDYLNKKFREIYYNYNGYKIKRLKICNSFLKINKELID